MSKNIKVSDIGLEYLKKFAEDLKYNDADAFFNNILATEPSDNKRLHIISNLFSTMYYQVPGFLSYLSKIPPYAFSDDSSEWKYNKFGMPYDEVIVPSNVTSLSQESFALAHIKKVVLPNTITEIPKYCFPDSKIEELILPKNLTTLRYGCFDGLYTKMPIYLPDSIISIEHHALYFDTGVVVRVNKNNTALIEQLKYYQPYADGRYHHFEIEEV